MNANVIALNPGNTELRDRIRALMEGDRSLTQTRIAKEVGVSQTTFSQWRSGTYNGDNEAVEAKILRWLETFQAERQAESMLPDAPSFVGTPTGLRVVAALRYAQMAGDIAVVYGGAGLGKTTAIQHYAQTAPNVWVATMTPAEASVVPALEAVCEAVGIRDVVGGAARIYKQILKRVANTHGLLVIDEAQHLSTQALDQLRSIHDATGVGIALVGNETVYARMSGGNRAAYLDRLFSRIGKKVRLVKSSAEDVDGLLEAWGIVERACRGTLHEIAAKPGALRLLTKVMRLAAMYARARKESVCCDDVRAAWRELGGAE